MTCPSCGVENPGGATSCMSCGADLDLSPRPASSSSTDITPSGGFVGRQPEMRGLLSALDDALSGKGRLVMLAGEPGIGKTRTAQELAACAEIQGAQVLWGRCYEVAGAPPYWPWIQPFKLYLERTDPEQIGSDMGLGASDIAEMIPELREKLPHLESPLALEPEQARFRLFNSIASFLRNGSQRKPMVLVLDDLHWADRSSLLLLQFLSQQIGDSHLMVIGTYRDVEVGLQHPLADTLAQLSREPVFRRQSLRGLSLEDVGQLFEMFTGVRPTQQLIHAVYARTEGNPFFTAEVFRLFGERADMKDLDGSESVATVIPSGVLEVISRRLNRLSSQCHQALTTAAIIGREFDFHLLSMLCENNSDEDLLDVIDEALEAHLIEEVPDLIERYQFCHALIQESLTQQLSSSRKVRLHARIAKALEELHGVAIEAHAAELAYHFGAAQSLLGPEKLATYSLIAGEHSIAAYANEEALSHFRRGLAAKAIPTSSSEPVKDAEAAALLFGLGRAEATTLPRQRLPEAMINLNRSLDYYAEVGDVERVIAIAEFPLYPLIGRQSGNAQLIARALSLVPTESPAVGHLLSRYGRVMALEEGDCEGARKAFTRALSIARRAGDAILEMRTLADAANVDMIDGRIEESLEMSLQAVELARRGDNPYIEALARYNVALSYLCLGNLAGTRLHASAMQSSAEKLRDRFLLTLALRLSEVEAQMEGDWQAALEFSERGLAVSPMEPRTLCTRTVQAYQIGDFAQGEAFLQRLVEVMYETPPGPTLEHALTAMVIPLVARISGRVYLLEVAEAAAETVLSAPSRLGFMDTYARIGLGLLGAHRNDATAAASQYGFLEPHRSIIEPFILTTIDRVLGVLVRTTGNLDKAIEHFEDSLSFCRKAGYQPELAWTCCDYADTLLQRKQLGDQEKAMSLLDESIVISSELNMRPLMDRVVALQERAKAQPAKAPAYPDGLTQREVEVLGLIAAGKTDREIAEELSISVTTVSTHVRNLLNKTNVANRTEAAMYAVRHGLV